MRLRHLLRLALAVAAGLWLGCDRTESTPGSQAASAPATPYVPGFVYLRHETFSCGGQTHTVAIYQHEKTALEFVLVPGGTFMMGSPEGEETNIGIERDLAEKDRYQVNCEHPQHPVTVRSFMISRTEVTQTAWEKLKGVNRSVIKGPTLPLEVVSWNQARKWCHNAGLRLPTEAEWEYACRAGTLSRFYFGNDDVTLDEYAWTENNSDSVTHPVGLKKPNAFGLFDMIGNVWEWCEDNWHNDYNGAPTEGGAWLANSSDRVIRGNGFDCGLSYCRSAFRHTNGSDGSTNFYGFRPACSLPEPQAASPPTSQPAGRLPASALTPASLPASSPSRPDVPGFGYLRHETFSCGGQTHTVAIYKHEKTELEFVLVPGGTFTMGSPDGENGRDGDEGPQHRVTVKPFLLCRTEAPNSLYAKYNPYHDSGMVFPITEKNSYLYRIGPDGQKILAGSLNGPYSILQKLGNKLIPNTDRNLKLSLRGDTQPVVNLTWEDAYRWSWQMGLRLPTEAEWEYACRAGVDTPCYWGVEEAESGRYANMADLAAVKEWPGITVLQTNDGYAVTAPIGKFLPNAFGLFDMVGNAWEWCQDAYHEPLQGALIDRSALSIDSLEKATRGGSWENAESGCCRVNFRQSWNLKYKSGGIGFRPACSLPEPQAASQPASQPAGRAPASAPAPASQPASAPARPIVPGFVYLRHETFSCGGQTNTVAIYKHEKTELEFVLVPGGEFMMGSSDNAIENYPNEKPQHLVKVNGFLFSRSETTVSAWNKYLPYFDKHQKPSLPVENISWKKVKLWCEKAGLRLPSEAEWEYACRAGSIGPYCFGEDDSILDDHCWNSKNSNLHSHPVGLKFPNPFGLFDIYGNVWEWCEDNYQDNYSNFPLTGHPSKSMSKLRVYRGGGYMGRSMCRSSVRAWGDEGTGGYNLGFRPACSIP